MATTKTTLASGTYININASTTKTFTASVRADVIGDFPSTMSSSSILTNLTPSNHVTNPGVFTQGTAPEGTLSNPTNDSNS